MKFEVINEIRIPIPESYKDAFQLIQSDFVRIGKDSDSILRMFLFTLIEPSAAFLFWFRLSAYKKGMFLLICKLIYRHYKFKYGLMIPSCTKVGYGLYIGHPFGILVSYTAVIGNNCNLSQFTNIGTNKGAAAIIGDNVYIGPSVCLVENVKIGNNVTIGAGAVVTRDIPENATAAGVPARVLSYNNPGQFIKNRFDTRKHSTPDKK